MSASSKIQCAFGSFSKIMIRCWCNTLKCVWNAVEIMYNLYSLKKAFDNKACSAMAININEQRNSNWKA
jgi:hypothetical protein